MSAKYGVTIRLSGLKDEEDKCLTELSASLRREFEDRSGRVSYRLPAIPGSYWARVRKVDEQWATDDIVVSYMMTTPEFWSASHDEGIKQLAVRWPSLTLFMYGDSFEAGDGFRILYVGGRAIVDDVFLLDQNDRPTDVKRRVFGEGINEDNVLEHVPEKYSEDFQDSEVSDLPQTWEEVRAEVAAATLRAPTDS